MEIRALTGFDMQTRQEYGRSYTPLNGCKTLLGAISGDSIVSFETEVLVKDPNTGKKKWLTVENAQQLIDLIAKGFKLFGRRRRRRSGNRPPDPPIESTSNTKLGTMTMIGIGVAAIALIIILKNK